VTRRAKLTRRVSAIALVGATVGIALAATGSKDISVAPRILGIRHTAGMQSSASVTLTNSGSAASTIGSIVGACGPSPAVQLLGGSGSSPFTIPASGTMPIAVDCPAALEPGLHRCTFTALDMSLAPVVAFEAFCETVAMQQLSAAPASLSFTDTAVGGQSTAKSLAITNQSTTTTVPELQLQLDDDNFVIGAPCQDQLSCTLGPIPPQGTVGIDIACRPGTTGAHTGKLIAIGSNGFALAAPIAVDCAGTAATAAVLALIPGNVTLPPVEVEGATGLATIAMRNAGAVTLTIETVTTSDTGVVGAGADWSVTVDGQCAAVPCLLAAGQTLFARLRFDPSKFASRPARLTVNYTDPMGSKQALASLDGRGRGATAELIATPPLDFGTVRPGAVSTALQLVLDNRGNRSTTVNFAASPMAPFSFMTTATLDPGRTTFSLSCSSATELEVTRTLTITSPAAPIPQTVSLHCDVRDTAVFADPSTLQLGELRTTSTIPDVEIVVDDTGTPVDLPDPPTLVPANPNLELGPFDRTMTPAITSLSITPVSVGAFGPTIEIKPATPAEQIDVPVTGTVVNATFTTTPVMTLGTFCAGQPTSPTASSFVSTGTATIAIASASLAAGASSPLTVEPIVPTAYPAALAPQAKATVLVTPRRAKVAGDVSDDLVWTTDAGNPHVVLTAKFVADGGAIAPGALDFGQVPIRIAIDNDQAVTLQNCSTGQLDLLAPEIPAPFELTDQFPMSLAPAGRASFSVAFHPTQIGVVDKELVVTSADGLEFRVALHGEGVSGSGSGGDDDGPGERTSFYSCGGCVTDDPSGVAAAFACIVIVLARRRRKSN